MQHFSHHSDFISHSFDFFIAVMRFWQFLQNINSELQDINLTLQGWKSQNCEMKKLQSPFKFFVLLQKTELLDTKSEFWQKTEWLDINLELWDINNKITTKN